MIYLFAGDDSINKRTAYEKFLAALPKGRPVFHITKNDFDPQTLESFYSGAGLFFDRCAVVLSGTFENPTALDLIQENLGKMAESENDFIILESKLNKPILDNFKKARAELNIFELTGQKKEKFNNFLLADDFADRRKLDLWIHFRQALDRGVSMEELAGILFWKAKDMIIKKNFRKFTEAELANFAKRMSYVLPEARKGGLDDEATFEKFLLEAL